MTAKEQLATAGADAWCAAEDAWLDGRQGGPRPTDAYLDALLAHPDLLLRVLAETGVLRIQGQQFRSMKDGMYQEPNRRQRYVSPWVPSGDQT